MSQLVFSAPQNPEEVGSTTGIGTDSLARKKASKSRARPSSFGLALYFCFVCLFSRQISLGGPGYPETYFVDQAGLEFRDPSASGVLGD
jgi:hypothetical protein